MAKTKKATTAKASPSKGELKGYELALLIKPLLPFDVQQKVVAPITDYVNKAGGTIQPVKDSTGKEIELTKKHLAYPIRRHEEGYYGFFNLKISAADCKELEKQLKFNNDILRFLVIAEHNL